MRTMSCHSRYYSNQPNYDYRTTCVLIEHLLDLIHAYIIMYTSKQITIALPLFYKIRPLLILFYSFISFCGYLKDVNLSHLNCFHRGILMSALVVVLENMQHEVMNEITKLRRMNSEKATLSNPNMGQEPFHYIPIHNSTILIIRGLSGHSRAVFQWGRKTIPSSYKAQQDKNYYSHQASARVNRSNR